MKIMFRVSFLFPAMFTALVSSCASPGRLAEMKKDPFADPSKFESLASNAYTQPVVSITPLVEETPRTAHLLLLDGSSLVSSPDVPLVSHAALQREVASTGTVVTGDTHAVVPVGTAVANGFTVVPAPGVIFTGSASLEAPAEVRNPDTAFLTLVRGNERFINGTVRGENRGEARRRALTHTQDPSAVILSSSDSRVPPELIFDQGLGDLSVVRVAGGVLGSAQVATIEHAIKKMDAKLIVVMGHEGSAAVQAAVESKSGDSTDEQWLLSSIQSNLKGRSLASVPGNDPKFRKPAMANVDAVSDQLMLRSKIVSDAVHTGQVKIVRGIYALETGKVDFWGLK